MASGRPQCDRTDVVALNWQDATGHDTLKASACGFHGPDISGLQLGVKSAGVADELTTAGRRCLQSDASRLVIDLHDVTFVDWSGPAPRG